MRAQSRQIDIAGSWAWTCHGHLYESSPLGDALPAVAHPTDPGRGELADELVPELRVLAFKFWAPGGALGLEGFK